MTMSAEPAEVLHRPRRLVVSDPGGSGYAVQTDGAKVYFENPGEAMNLVARLIYPALNVEPAGNC